MCVLYIVIKVLKAGRKSSVLKPLKKLCGLVFRQRSFVSHSEVQSEVKSKRECFEKETLKLIAAVRTQRSNTSFFHTMLIRNFSLSLVCLLWLAQHAAAQEYVLSCSRWSDMANKSTRNTASTISIDSSLITISQGPTNLYLEIKKQSRNENIFTYEVIDPNDQPATATFSPEDMVFDYRAGQFWLRYFIESIAHPVKEVTAPPTDSSSVTSDTAAVAEDTKIYDAATVMPEFPGGKEAMDKFIAENLKYPAAAKKNNNKGVVTVTAVVEKNGSLTEVKVKKDIGGGCGEEAARVVKLMPTWIPGLISNEDKRVRVVISMFFPAG